MVLGLAEDAGWIPMHVQAKRNFKSLCLFREGKATMTELRVTTRGGRIGETQEREPVRACFLCHTCPRV